MLRRRPWSLRDCRRCTTSTGLRIPRYSTSSRDAAASAPLDSLIAYGERVLRSPEPADKVALTLECQQLWRSGALPIYTGAAWTSNPPDQPARSAKPPLFTPKLMPSPKDMDAPIPVIMLHALGHIELGAIDNYWDTLVRFDPATYKLPKSFYDDFLTVASDEARHFKMVDDRLRELGSYYGALPATRALLEHAANTTAALAARIAVVPLVQEARGLDSGDRLVHKLQSMGDKQSARVVAQIVHEERSHVSFGIKWFRHLCANVVDPPCDPVPLFHELVLQYFPDGLPGPFDMEARLAADMEAAWYQPLEAKPRQHHGASAKSSSATPAATQPVDTEEAATSARLRAFAAAKKKIILTGSVWPERTSSAAGVRSCDLIEIFQSYGYHVICVSPSRLNAHTETLARDHDVQCVQADANSDTFQKLLQELAPQIVVFDRFIAEEMYGWQAKKYAPSALRVLDLQDVHFLRRARELLVKKRNVPFTETLDFRTLPLDVAGAELEKPVIRELASIHRSDLTLFVSDVERDALTSRFQIPESLLHRCDFFYPPVPALHEMKSYDQRQDIAFIGSFKHAPNVDGIEWLKREVAPVFRNEFLQSSQPNKIPEIHIYGSYSQDAKKYKALHDPKNGFKLMGFAPDVHETLSAYRLSVAPLRFGAGIKGKIADSWFNGTPCVATSIGAEGMYMNGTRTGTRDAWGGLAADDPVAFARAMRDLYVDPARWLGAQQRGLEICTTRYDKTRNATTLMARLEQALVQQENQRRENWVGRILWSEKYRATEFMSRFIRLKNEKSETS